MSTSAHQLNRPLVGASRHESPVRALLVVSAAVFAGEAVVMVVLSALPPMPPLLAALVDSLFLLVIVFPALYFFLLRPLRVHLAERRRAELSLAKSRELFDRLFSIAHVLLAYMDPQFNFIQVNRAFAEANGKTPNHFTGRNHFELFPNAELEAIFRGVVETGEPYIGYATYGFLPARKGAYWDWKLIPTTDSAGRAEGLLLSLSDVTKLKQSEQEIRRRNRELSDLHAISTALSSSLEMPHIMKSLRNFMIVRASFPVGSIYSYDAAAQELQRELSWDIRSPDLPLVSSDASGEREVRRLSPEQAQCLCKDGELIADFPSGSPGCLHIPLIAHGEIQGLMEVANDAGASYPGAEYSGYLQAVGQIAGIALHNTRLFAREQKARQSAEVLRQAGLALTQSLDISTVMAALLDFTERLVPYESASILLAEDNFRLAVSAARGCDCEKQVQRGERLTLERGRNPAIEEVIAKRRGKIVADTSGDPVWLLTPCNRGTRSWLGVPFVAGDTVIGVCALAKKEAGFFTTAHLQLAELLASQAAVAVQNAWLFEQLRAGRERLQKLSRQLVEVQENERCYVARELHDEAGQVLTSLIVGLRLLERDVDEPQSVIAGIAKLKQMVDGVLENLHRLAMDLRPASLDHLGLVAALRQHLEAIADLQEITVQFETVGLDSRLPRDIEVTLYRIVQEALANVVRHARATRVDVFLERRTNKILAIIEDNGVGFTEEVALNSGRLGLFGMRERAEMLGGTLIVEGGVSGGTTVSVEVPCADTDSDCR